MPFVCPPRKGSRQHIPEISLGATGDNGKGTSDQPTAGILYARKLKSPRNIFLKAVKTAASGNWEWPRRNKHAHTAYSRCDIRSLSVIERGERWTGNGLEELWGWSEESGGVQEDSGKLSARNYVFIIRRTISLVSKWRLRFMFVSWRRLTGACSSETPADVGTGRLQNCDTNLTNVDEMTTLHTQKFFQKSAFQASKRGFRIKNQRFSPIPPTYAILCRVSFCRTSKKLFIFVEYNHPALTTHKTY